MATSGSGDGWRSVTWDLAEILRQTKRLRDYRFVRLEQCRIEVRRKPFQMASIDFLESQDP